MSFALGPAPSIFLAPRQLPCRLPHARSSCIDQRLQRRLLDNTCRQQRLTCKAAAVPAVDNGTLKLIVQGRNLKLTEALKAYADQKISKALSKFARATKEVDVTLSVAGGNRGRGDEKQKCEITVFTLRNGVVRAEDVEENLYAAIDKVCDMVTRKMRKVKEKAIVKGKWEGSAGPRINDFDEDGVTSDGEVPQLAD